MWGKVPWDLWTPGHRPHPQGSPPGGKELLTVLQRRQGGGRVLTQWPQMGQMDPSSAVSGTVTWSNLSPLPFLICRVSQ